MGFPKVSSKKALEETGYKSIEAALDAIDKYLDDMRQRFGNMINPEVAGEKDVLFGDFVQLNADGSVLEGGITHTSKLTVDLVSDQEVKSKLIGSKVGDSIAFNPLKATGNVTEASAMLGISKEEVEGMESDFMYTISEISTMSPAENPNPEMNLARMLHTCHMRTKQRAARTALLGPNAQRCACAGLPVHILPPPLP